MRLAPIFLGFAMLASSATAEGSDTALARFFKAADVNDFAGMEAAMTPQVKWLGGRSISASKFIGSISNCYLRRVYADDISKTVIAAWMCDEGPGKSRVLLADVRQNGEMITLEVVREDHNKLPAPPRAGSAFATEAKP